MELKQYVEDAISTESTVETVVADPVLFSGVVQILIAAGNMLDQIKKNVFYGREFNQENLKHEMINIIGSLDQIKPSVLEQQVGIEMDFDTRIFHSTVGIATESIELLEALTAEEFDRVNFLEELGDINWYQAIGIDAVDGDFESILVKNLEKLSKSDKARYKDGFSAEDAIHRDVDAERSVLEDVNKIQ